MENTETVDVVQQNPDAFIPAEEVAKRLEAANGEVLAVQVEDDFAVAEAAEVIN